MLPDFYVLGAQKAGTSWLAAMLRQHPHVFIPDCKEIHFFDDDQRYRRGALWYEQHFAGAERARAVGEATPNYLAVNTRKAGSALQRIHTLTPGARFVVCLRNPTVRAVSALFHHVRKGRIPAWSNFDRTLLRMLEGGTDPWDVIAMGQYDIQLAAYFKVFPRQRFRILIFEEEVERRRVETLTNLCGFLGVSTFSFHRQSNLSNAGLRSRAGLALAQVLRWRKVGAKVAGSLERLDILPRVELSDTTIDALSDYYERTTSRVEELIGRDLSCWRRTRSTGPIQTAAAGSRRPAGSLV